MKMVVLLVGMAVLAWLASDYITNNRIRTADGTMANPDQVMQNAHDSAKKIEDDMAKRAADGLKRANE
jgi:hypothetical protein